MAEQNTHPAVSIAAVIGGISLSIVVVIAIFASDQLLLAAWIVAALVVMGLSPGIFVTKGAGRSNNRCGRLFLIGSGHHFGWHARDLVIDTLRFRFPS